jgi:hypothetical protein
MASSLFGKLAGLAKSPQGQKMISQATKKAQELAKDPATRAKIDQGAARVRAEVDKRRGGSGRSANPTDPDGPSDIPGSNGGTTGPVTGTTGPDVTPR